MMPDASKFVVEFETPDFVASIAVWSNGCCDLDVLHRRDSNAQAWHGEFADTDLAVSALSEIVPNLLICRSASAAGPA